MNTIDISVYNLKGEKMKTVRISEEIFGRAIKTELLHEIIVSQLSNRRQISASVKNRGDVKGGGRKPWRQKGTGRARHGSIRSPIWRGGGITFGPTTERIFKKKINKKKKYISLFMALSSKIKDVELYLIDDLVVKDAKTNVVVDLLDNLPLEWEKNSKKNKSILFGLCKEEKNLILSIRNIPRIKTMPITNLNALDLLSSKYFILSLKGIETIESHFFNKKTLLNDNIK